MNESAWPVYVVNKTKLRKNVGGVKQQAVPVSRSCTASRAAAPAARLGAVLLSRLPPGGSASRTFKCVI